MSRLHFLRVRGQHAVVCLQSFTARTETLRTIYKCLADVLHFEEGWALNIIPFCSATAIFSPDIPTENLE